jgi:hypothetical protein
MFKLSRVLVIVSLLFSQVAHAVFASPIGLAIVPPIEFPNSSFAIAGARVSALWGAHTNVYGFDIGVLGNITDNQFVGIGVSGLANLTRSSATILGLQAAGIANVNSKVNLYGVQIAAIMNHNSAESILWGLEVALGNYSPFMTVIGAQIGIFNQARTIYGFQIGLVNYAENLHGLQIGIANFNPRGIFAVSPLLNIGF